MFTCVLLMALLSVSAEPTTWISFTGDSPSPPSFEALESNQFGTLVRMRLSGVEVVAEEMEGSSFQSLRIPRSGLTTETGKPEIPVVTTLVAIPARTDCQVRIVGADSVVLSGYRVLPAQKACLEGEESEDFRIDETLYSVDSFYPEKLVVLGQPCVMRDYRVVQLILYPVRYNPYRSQLIVYREVLVEIEYAGENITNAKEITPKLSFAFDPLYRNLIVNYEFVRPKVGEVTPGGYLIVSHDAFYDAIQPLAEWKQRKGWKTSVVKLSEIPGGPNTTSIQQYISDAYHNWVVPPEYVLLVGDVTGAGPLPTFPYLGNPTDHPYSLLEGNDYLSEVLVGRIPVQSVNELQVVVSKILGYERNPYMGETQWYRRALVVGGNYPAEVTTAVLTKKWVREKLLEAGYAEVDTVFYPPITAPDDILASVSQGVSFVNYRGWSNSRGWHYPYFQVENILALANGWKLPVVTSISCGTGNFGAGIDPCFGEAWLRAGTPTTPKGGVAFYGPTTLATQTRWNNSLDSGIYWGILREDLFSFAQAAYRGKVEVHNNFPNNTAPGGEVEFYFHVYNALGDPELVMWTDVPESLVVQHLPTIPVGTNFFNVLVKRSDSQPLRGALISLVKPGEVEITGTTGADGSIELPISVSTPDTMWVTVTKHNFIPFSGHTLVGLTALYVGHKSHAIDDDNSGGSQGNGDGGVNPGETLELPIVLKNYGSSNTAAGVTATLRSSDDFVTITDSVKSYGDISPGDTAVSSPFIFSVAQSCTNLHQIRFHLGVTSSDSLWTSIVDIPV